MKSKLLTTNYERFTPEEWFTLTAPSNDYCTLDTSTTPDFEEIGDGWNSHCFSHVIEQIDVEEFITETFANTPLIFARVWHRKSATYTLSLKSEIDDVEAIIVHSTGQVQLYPGGDDVTNDLGDFFTLEDVDFGGSSYSDGDYMISNGVIYSYQEY